MSDAGGLSTHTRTYTYRHTGRGEIKAKGKAVLDRPWVRTNRCKRMFLGNFKAISHCTVKIRQTCP